ncbi:hypothetical protein GQ55_4G242700 [Panicum hallii var. hallii]|uniref:Uncharacterized protein n=1 Tax=Panicum hallii var. hallii TaxID=1504633 RepID=A0A2T7DZS3_9POAL|nr:hypothetical protein GQ55_4G242700 [Panicum hallii var. hallii]PUZ61086.1 hypothetical protein GQ55_4G242700 [Panicum hallii var. hallii]PUZ61087.1 hypothetical protein GQ55_4G242700 [Panicum hallii var. hallii]
MSQWVPISSFFSIVGHGGFGKTTLAQLIYSEKNVQNYFDLHIWVSVSSHFDALAITKSIIEAITKESTSANTLESLHAILEEKLISKRLLLIFDNVWNDKDMNEWERLFAPLKICGSGSKILITTRMKSVGDMVGNVLGVKGEHLKLGGLQEKDLLMLFSKYAFCRLDLKYPTNLHSLGEQIVKRLGGCPLAAKVIGAHLSSNMSFVRWKKILQDDFQNLQIAKDGIIKVLRLSYHYLPANLQLCFRYCSIFPQGYKFGKKELMEMWLGSGLILRTANESQPLEDTAAEYLDLLARKSFFDFTSIERAGVVLEEYYVMHDIMHDMARAVSSGECLRTAGIGFISIAKTVRHLSIKIEDSVHLKELCHLNKLRSLVIKFVGDDPSMTYYLTFSEVLKELKALRILCLTTKCQFHLPDAISNLVHLRYISVFISKRSFLVSVHKLFSLYHLQALKIMEYSDGKMLKLDGMGNLVCLRNLHVPYDILSSIPRIGNLTCLQELYGFSLQRKKGYSITELRNLTQLRHLRLRDIQNIDKYEEILDAKLKEKKQLRTLSLHWASYDGDTKKIDDLVLENLQPHSDLEGLNIIGYNGTRLPSWMRSPYLITLVSLKIIKCGKMEQLPSLTSLCSLENLYLQDLSVLVKIGCFSNGSIGSSSEGMGYTGSNEVFPPHLNTLKIRGCPRLRELPTMPSGLNQLKILNSGLIHLPYMQWNYTEGTVPLSNNSRLTNVLIEDCPDLTSLAEGFFKQPVYLESIRDIHIFQCEKLEYLPPKGFSELVNLQNLEISYCSMLSGNALEVKLLPSSLENLTITSCGKLENILIGSLTGLNSLNLLKFSECNHMTSLPSTETFKTLTALSTVRLCDCPELSTLGGLQCLESLRYLSIDRCHKLAMIPSRQPSLFHGVNEDGNENLLKLALCGTTEKHLLCERIVHL